MSLTNPVYSPLEKAFPQRSIQVHGHQLREMETSRQENESLLKVCYLGSMASEAFFVDDVGRAVSLPRSLVLASETSALSENRTDWSGKGKQGINHHQGLASARPPSPPPLLPMCKVPGHEALLPMDLPPPHQAHQTLPLTYSPKQATHGACSPCPTPKETKDVPHKDSPKPSLGWSLLRPSQGTRICMCHLHLNSHTTGKKGPVTVPKDKAQERLGPFSRV